MGEEEAPPRRGMAGAEGGSKPGARATREPRERRKGRTEGKEKCGSGEEERGRGARGGRAGEEGAGAEGEPGPPPAGRWPQGGAGRSASRAAAGRREGR